MFNAKPPALNANEQNMDYEYTKGTHMRNSPFGNSPCTSLAQKSYYHKFDLESNKQNYCTKETKMSATAPSLHNVESNKAAHRGHVIQARSSR